jgi:PAS domain S-box-containing protein
MSHPERAVSDRSATLLADSKRLVAISRQNRQTARTARYRAAVLLSRCSAAKRALSSAGTVTIATTFTRRAGIEPGTDRRRHDRLARPGRRQTDRRPRAADSRRVLLAGPDKAWRLLLTYLFEEAGYVVDGADDPTQAAGLSIRLLPDVVVVHMEIGAALQILDRLARTPGTFDIPVVVLTPSVHSADASRVQAAGAVTLLPHDDDAEVLVGEVDTLIAVGPRARRSLKRRLLDLQELARLYTPDADGQARLRRLIDHLQVAILAVDAQGHCIADSQGATVLTGYSHLELLTTSVFETVFPDGQLTKQSGLDLLEQRQNGGTTTIVDHAGRHVTVYAAAVEEILPGFHVAALAAADPRLTGVGGSDRTGKPRRTG